MPLPYRDTSEATAALKSRHSIAPALSKNEFKRVDRIKGRV
jgi:hypothetical protein